jgi:hypothetical protein
MKIKVLWFFLSRKNILSSFFEKTAQPAPREAKKPYFLAVE